MSRRREPRHLPDPKLDPRLTRFLGAHLDQVDDGSVPGWSYSIGPRVFLWRVVDVELPKLKDRRHRAYDYGVGMLEWHLEETSRRPIRGRLRCFEESDYEALDAVAVKVLDFWAGLVEELGAPVTPEEILKDRFSYELRPVLAELATFKPSGPRRRLGALAEAGR